VLRVTVLKNTVAAVTAYFAGGRGDYYAEGMEEVAGEWGGKAAERLGLEDIVTKDVFEALCRNERPGAGEPLTPRTNAERRIGFDLTFSCPKSISILYGLTVSPEMHRAFCDSVDETMRELEAFAETRVRRGGSDHLRRTGNLLWASFIHDTTRPVDGYPDPHLHCHAVAFNLTWDDTEGRFKALDLVEVKKRAPYFEAAFESRLAMRLRELGFDIVPTSSGWEIAGIPERMHGAFSRRTALIEQRARELGITNAKAKDTLGVTTRERKQPSLTVNELRSKWWSLLTDNEREAVRAVAARELFLAPLDPNAAQKAIEFAAKHLFERQSVVPIETFFAHALRHGIGQVTVEQLREQLPKSGLLIRERDGVVYVTSREVLLEEIKMLAFAREGRGVLSAIRSTTWTIQDPKLSAEQRAVIDHVLQSRDRVMVVRGVAGSGKTTLMREAVSAIEASGLQVVTLAPSAEASRGVLRSEGFASADTVARFLVDERLQESARWQVLWIDEAGLLGSPTMAKLFTLADKLQARVILSGDEQQHASVERGSVLRLLQTDAGIEPVSVLTIRRQSGRYREAVEKLSHGDTIGGFNILDQMGWILEVADGEREAKLAADYLSAVADGKSVLIVCPTHAEGRRITDAIRNARCIRGLVSGDEHLLTRFESRGLTVADRGLAMRYRLGDVVEFHVNAPAFTKGSRYTVVQVGRSSVIVKDAAGMNRILPLQLADKFDVFTALEIRLSVCDQIRITRNGKSKTKSHRLDNGTVHTVKAFTPSGDIELSSGAIVSSNYGHLVYGYCITSHAAQGKTVDRVLIAQSSESFPATSREQFYVSASRARESLTVYTNDKAALRHAIQKTDPRVTATELMKPSANHPAWLAWVRQRMRFVQRMADQMHGAFSVVSRSPSREVSR
jgi:conjugative relaxase-like TrwC/TraI family protein